MTRRFEELKVWQLSHNFVLMVYNLLKKFPVDERFALADQLRRAAVSIPSNIAEGVAKKTTKEFCQNLYIARGSLSEVRYYLVLAKDLGYITAQQYNEAFNLLNEIRKMLSGLINSLATNDSN